MNIKLRKCSNTLKGEGELENKKRGGRKFRGEFSFHTMFDTLFWTYCRKQPLSSHIFWYLFQKRIFQFLLSVAINTNSWEEDITKHGVIPKEKIGYLKKLISVKNKCPRVFQKIHFPNQKLWTQILYYDFMKRIYWSGNGWKQKLKIQLLHTNSKV